MDTPSRAFWTLVRWRTALRIASIALIPIALFALYRSGLYAEVDAEAAAAWLRDQGAWGVALFVLATALIQPMHVSIYVFLVTASLVWTPPVAAAVAWCAVMASALTSYGFARFIARDWVQARLPDRLRRYEDLLIQRPFRTTLFLRFTFFTTPLVQMMFGVCRIPFRPFIAATALGVLPQTLFGVLIGEGAIVWLQSYEPQPKDLALATGVALLAGGAVLWRRRSTAT